MNFLDARFVLLLAGTLGLVSSEEIPITKETSHLDILERITERTASLKSWSADFRQVRMASLLKDPVLSTGKMHVLQPFEESKIRKRPMMPQRVKRLSSVMRLRCFFQKARLRTLDIS